jgi:AAA domain
MRLYGEANNVRGLATGPIETRFSRLRSTCAADSLVVWTTPGRWAAGEGLSLRFPDIRLEFVCTLADGHLTANKVTHVPDDARSPEREAGAVGVVVRAERVALPPENASVNGLESDPGVAMLESHFARLAGRRWGGFVAPLRAALEAEAQEDEARTQRLTVPFKDAQLTRSGEEDIWRLKGVAAEALRALDDGEWLELLDQHGRSRTSARVIDTHPSTGSLVAGVRTAADPPRAGFLRPRSRRKILEQKRALLEELASPTGSLPNLVRLVAAPASMPASRQVRPARFVNPAVVRNRSQSRAVSLALGLEEGQVLLIQGPPGTGKSTTAAEIDVQLILRDPGVRILVCSHSNHGTDNMLMKVLPFLDDAQERIARIGFYERIAKEARPFYAGPDTEIGDKNIIFTTIDALVLQDIAGANVYDYVIVDEANRAGVLDSLLALARGKRMILVGDPMQLQPVMSEAEQQIVAQVNGTGRRGRRGRGPLVGVAQPGGNNVIGKSLFAWIQERRFSPAASVLLDQQNRMHPAIGDLVSRVFYANRVRTGPAAPRRGTGLPAFPSPVTWVDTRSLRGNVESRAGGTSLFNVAEARLVTSITRHLASHAPPNLSIGVITAYLEQRDLLRRLMGPHDWPPERQLEIDTVDAFEGREKDIIVLSLVRSNRRRDIGFLRLEQRLNVAVSRSRRLIIIVGDTSTLRSGYFHTLINTAQSVGQIVPAPKLIGQLLQRARRPRRERGEEAQPIEGEERVGLDAAAADGRGPAAEGREAAVAPTGAPGFERPAGPGSGRRRRRRAWERRRERLRALQEQQAALAAQGLPPEEHPELSRAGLADQPQEFFAEHQALVDQRAGPSDHEEPGLAEPQPPGLAVRRRPRRFDGRPPGAQADQAPAGAEVPPVPGPEGLPDRIVPPEVLVPLGPRRRRRLLARQARLAESATPGAATPLPPTPVAAEPPGGAALEAEVEPAPPTREPFPARRRSRRPATRVAELASPSTAEPAQVEEPTPPRRRRRTAETQPAEGVPTPAAEELPAPVTEVAQVEQPTPARRRGRRASAATPAVLGGPEPAEAGQPEPALQPVAASRRRRAALADTPATSQPLPLPEATVTPEPVHAPEPVAVPEPAPGPEPVTADPARRRRTTRRPAAEPSAPPPMPDLAATQPEPREPVATQPVLQGLVSAQLAPGEIGAAQPATPEVPAAEPGSSAGAAMEPPQPSTSSEEPATPEPRRRGRRAVEAPAQEPGAEPTPAARSTRGRRTSARAAPKPATEPLVSAAAEPVPVESERRAPTRRARPTRTAAAAHAEGAPPIAAAAEPLAGADEIPTRSNGQSRTRPRGRSTSDTAAPGARPDSPNGASVPPAQEPAVTAAAEAEEPAAARRARAPRGRATR